MAHEFKRKSEKKSPVVQLHPFSQLVLAFPKKVYE